MTTLAPSPVSPVKPTERTLTAHDRCDSCNAQAYVSVTFASGELLLCGHHYTKSKAKIHASALFVRDETEFINVSRKGPANGFS